VVEIIGGWRKLYNKDLEILQVLLESFLKRGRMRRAGYVTCMGEGEREREECIGDLCRNSEGHRSLGLHRLRLEDRTKLIWEKSNRGV
jgi:hypothetical protein